MWIITFAILLTFTPFVTFDNPRNSGSTASLTLDHEPPLYVADGPYVERGPIIIESIIDFEEQGWSGSGTASDPYEIQGFNITSNDDCISISNVDVHFVIRNCVLSSTGGYYGTGIHLSDVMYGTIQDCLIHSKFIGVYADYTSLCNFTDNELFDNTSDFVLEHSSNWTIDRNIASGSGGGLMLLFSENCTLNDNLVVDEREEGVSMFDCTDCTIANSTFVGNSVAGVFLHYSMKIQIVNCRFINNDRTGLLLQLSLNCTVADCLFENDGIQFRGQSEWNWRHVISNVTVNGLPLGYFVSARDMSLVAYDYGQVIMVGCNNLSISQGGLHDCSIGLTVAYSTDIWVRHVSLQGNDQMAAYLFQNERLFLFNVSANDNRGPILFDSCYASIADRISVFNQDDGIIFRNCEEFIITSCTLYCRETGLYLEEGIEGWIDGCSIAGSNIGIHAYNTQSFHYWYNSVYYTSFAGILAEYNDDASYINNHIDYNDGIGFYFSHEQAAYVIENEILFNVGVGIIFESGGSNRIYGNLILFNEGGNAFDSGDSNIWDNGNSIGNTWSGYNGSIPYHIDGPASAVDNYARALAYSDITPPSIQGPSYLNLPIETGTILEFQVADSNPDAYRIYRNGRLLEWGFWERGLFEILIEGLPAGTYNYTICLYDEGMNRATWTVIIEVGPPVQVVIYTFVIGGIVALLIILEVRQRPRRWKAQSVS